MVREPFDWLTPACGINWLYQVRAAALEGRIPLEHRPRVVRKLVDIVTDRSGTATDEKRILCTRLLMDLNPFGRPRRTYHRKPLNRGSQRGMHRKRLRRANSDS
jgi:hypothetical protein